MPAIPLAQNSYARAGGLTPEIRLLNLFTEPSPSNLKTGLDLFTRPTLTRFANVGQGPIRSVFWEDDVFSDDMLAVSGTELFRVTDAAVSSYIGAVPGTGQAQIACSPTEALIANGGALLSTDGTTVTAKSFPDDQAVASVGYLNGYFLAVPVDSHRIYYTDPLTGEFDGTRVISAERYADNIARLIVTSDEVWAMGSGSCEVFVPTGLDTADNPPFQRVEGRLYRKGAANASAIVEADNSVFWVGQSKDAGLVVYRGGDVPEVISTPAISERLAACDLTTISVWAFGTLGHLFIVLGLGTEGTWVYDVPQKTWLNWTSYARDQWRAWTGRGAWPGLVIAGDDEDGVLWQLSDAGTSDDGAEVVQTWTAGLPVDGRTSNNSVQLDCAVGQGSATVRLRYSDDQGRTWHQHDDQDLIAGRYLQRLYWTRLGTIEPPGRVYEWTTTDAIRMRVSGARANDGI